jgi:DNA topoisomerase I
MAREMLCLTRDMSKTAVNPIDSAKDAGLRYVSGEVPGITRRKKGRGFAYFAADGTLVRQDAILKRIRALVIPPAWTRVWICPQAEGHLQAVGRDARGRKQYRYHPLYREVRDQVKFDRMVSFGAALTKIRRRIRRDLKLPGMPKPKILAAVVRLLDETCVRVGNDEYTRSNGSYGLTTLHNKHAAIRGAELRLHFRGKSGQAQDVTLHDDQLARIVKRCQDLPGAELFQYQSESGELQSIGSGDVNDYLREITGEDITAKDFRTWHGTGHMFSQLKEIGPAESETEAKRNIVAAIKATAAKLGNRPATCRKYYIHPAVIESYLTKQMFRLRPPESAPRTSLRSEEVAVLHLLKQFDSPQPAAMRRPPFRKTRVRESKARTWALAS